MELADILTWTVFGVIAVTAICLGTKVHLELKARRPGEETPQDDTHSFVRQYWLPLALAGVGLLYFHTYRPDDALALFLIGAVGVVLLELKWAARKTAIDRGDVGAAMASGLVAMASVVSSARPSHWMGEYLQLEGDWSLGALIVGAFACAYLSGRFQLWLLLTVSSLLLVGSQARWFGDHFQAPPDRDAVVEFVESEDVIKDVSRSSGWELAVVLRRLAESSGSMPDTARLEAAIVRMLQSDSGTTSKPLETKLTELAYLRGRDYDEVGLFELAAILDGGRGWYLDAPLMDVVGKLRSPELDDVELESLAKQLAEAPLVPTEGSSLGHVVDRLSVFDQLGHPTHGECLREESLQLLSAGAERDEDDAVRLMERFGVPAELDLAAFRDRVALDAASYWRDGIDARQAMSILTLSALEGLPEWQPIAAERARLPALLVRNRVHLVAILLVAFCIIVTLRAPKAVAQPEAAA